jgi:two-component system NarL family sensor kinase
MIAMDQTRVLLNLYYWIGFSTLMVMVFAVFYISFHYYKTLFSKQKQFQHQVMEEALRSKETEQQRIARELHDSILGDIAALKITLNIQSKMLQKNQDPVWQGMDQTLGKMMADIRTLCYEMVPPILETMGLMYTIESVMKEKTAKTGKHFVLVQSFNPTLSSTHQLHVLRVVQEWMSNSIQHSQATEFKLTFDVHESGWCMRLEDNGKPFQWMQLMQQSTGLGWQLERENGNVLQLNFTI